MASSFAPFEFKHNVARQHDDVVMSPVVRQNEDGQALCDQRTAKNKLCYNVAYANETRCYLHSAQRVEDRKLHPPKPRATRNKLPVAPSTSAKVSSVSSLDQHDDAKDEKNTTERKSKGVAHYYVFCSRLIDNVPAYGVLYPTSGRVVLCQPHAGYEFDSLLDATRYLLQMHTLTFAAADGQWSTLHPTKSSYTLIPLEEFRNLSATKKSKYARVPSSYIFWHPTTTTHISPSAVNRRCSDMSARAPRNPEAQIPNKRILQLVKEHHRQQKLKADEQRRQAAERAMTATLNLVLPTQPTVATAVAAAVPPTTHQQQQSVAVAPHHTAAHATVLSLMSDESAGHADEKTPAGVDMASATAEASATVGVQRAIFYQNPYEQKRLEHIRNKTVATKRGKKTVVYDSPYACFLAWWTKNKMATQMTMTPQQYWQILPPSLASNDAISRGKFEKQYRKHKRALAAVNARVIDHNLQTGASVIIEASDSEGEDMMDDDDFAASLSASGKGRILDPDSVDITVWTDSMLRSFYGRDFRWSPPHWDKEPQLLRIVATENKYGRYDCFQCLLTYSEAHQKQNAQAKLEQKESKQLSTTATDEIPSVLMWLRESDLRPNPNYVAMIDEWRKQHPSTPIRPGVATQVASDGGTMAKSECTEVNAAWNAFCGLSVASASK